MATNVGVYHGARQRIIGRWANRPRSRAINTVILHIAVTPRSTKSLYGFFSGANGVCSHFFVADDGSVEQYMLGRDRDAASRDAASRSISIETAGGSGSDLGQGWSGAQIEALAQICAWAHRTYGVPLVATRTSKSSEAGIGFHRLGVPANRDQLSRSISQTGGELWSGATGKVCPGPTREAQIPAIIARAKAIIAGETSPPTSTPSKPKAIGRYKVTTRLLPLNGRSGPGTKYRKTMTAARERVLDIVEIRNGWAKSTGGHWYSMRYLRKV